LGGFIGFSAGPRSFSAWVVCMEGPGVEVG
jgi:hypothetical protein